MSPINIEQCEPAKMNVKYAAIVAGLLLLIIAVLGQLWLVERNRRADAESQLAAMYLKERVLEAAGVGATTEPAAARPAAIPRAELPTEKVKLNGRDRVVLLMDLQGGQAIGLKAGDVVIVSDDAGGRP